MGKKKQYKSQINTDTESDIMNVDVDAVLASLHKSFGKGIAFRTQDTDETYEKPVVSTGILSLDQALGIGGIPEGTIIELFGKEMSGKSSLAMKIAGCAQKLGYTVFYIDAEYALDLKLAENTGIDVQANNFVVIQPDYGEEAFSTIETVLDSKLKSIVVVDSVAALLPKEEYESNLTDSDRLGRIAALMSRSLRKLASKISKAGCSVIFVNQTRDQIGGFGFAGMKTTGGHALKFYSSIRLKITRAEQSVIKLDKEIIGHKANITVEKNKLARPFKQVVVDLFYGSGFSGLSDLVKIAEHEGIIQRAGAWYSYNGEQIAQGQIAALEWFVHNKQSYQEMRDKVLEALNITTLKHPDMYIDKTLAIKDAIIGVSAPLVQEAEEEGKVEFKSVSEMLKDDSNG